MIEHAIRMLSEKENMPNEVTYESMKEIMEGLASPVQIASFLTALKMKGETVDEIYSCARVLREKSIKVHSKKKNLVDTCGTGGDGTHTFNISTTAMFIAAACGINIAKHGNRSVTSKSGAADVLEKLGAKIDLTFEDVEKCIDTVGVGFMFAPVYHSSIRHAMPIRKELGFRTIFNILGPLANPASAKRQLLGVYDKNLVLKMAQVLQKLMVDHAIVVHGEDGLDEITLTGKTYVAEIKGQNIKEFTINPHDYGFEYCSPESLKGGMPDENAQILESILSGEKGPRTDIAILNAGVAIYLGGEAKSISEGIEMAKEAVFTAKPINILRKFVDFTVKVV